MKLVSLENITKYNELLNQKMVKSVNSVKPDANGNVPLGTEKSTFNKVTFDTDYFSVATDSTYSFDLTGTDLELIDKEKIQVRIVAKVTTANSNFEEGDIAELAPGVDHSDNDDLDVCAYIRGNLLYVYSGSSQYLSICNSTGWLRKDYAQIKVILTAFVPDDGTIQLIATDSTGTTELVGTPSGTLTWNSQNLVRSVNGVNADASGNVTLGIFPDYTARVQKVANTEYTAEKNGFIMISSSFEDLEVDIIIDNFRIKEFYNIGGAQSVLKIQKMVPIKKGSKWKALACSGWDAYSFEEPEKNNPSCLISATVYFIPAI